MNKLIAANWKMNKTAKESIEFIGDFKKLLKKEKTKNVEIIICPSFTSLQAVSQEIKKTVIKLGAQNMHFEEAGAYTGEISAAMLKESCEYVILGHSERREIFKEDDFSVNKKMIAALHNSLKPILCVGENFEQRENGKAKEIIKKQIMDCLSSVNKSQVPKVTIAYEPIWAISKGDPNKKSATANDAEEMHKFIRKVIATLYDKFVAKKMRIIYGGSMKPENAKQLLEMPNIDGGLVGNASLNAKSFFDIIKYTD